MALQNGNVQSKPIGNEILVRSFQLREDGEAQESKGET